MSAPPNYTVDCQLAGVTTSSRVDGELHPQARVQILMRSKPLARVPDDSVAVDNHNHNYDEIIDYTWSCNLPKTAPERMQPPDDWVAMDAYGNRSVFCCVSECGHDGELSRDAARKATTLFLNYVQQWHSTIVDVRDAALVIQRACYQVQQDMARESRHEITAMLAGIMMRAYDPSEPAIQQRCAASARVLQTPLLYVLGQIGNERVFVWDSASKKVHEVTQRMRNDDFSADAKHGGGASSPMQASSSSSSSSMKSGGSGSALSAGSSSSSSSSSSKMPKKKSAKGGGSSATSTERASSKRTGASLSPSASSTAAAAAGSTKKENEEEQPSFVFDDPVAEDTYWYGTSVKTPSMFVVGVNPKDMLFSMSRVVFENLDPQLMGKKPDQLNVGCSKQLWSQLSVTETLKVKANWRHQRLEALLREEKLKVEKAGGKWAPHKLLNVISQYVYKSTARARKEWDESRTGISVSHRRPPKALGKYTLTCHMAEVSAQTSPLLSASELEATKSKNKVGGLFSSKAATNKGKNKTQYENPCKVFLTSDIVLRTRPEFQESPDWKVKDPSAETDPQYEWISEPSEGGTSYKNFFAARTHSLYPETEDGPKINDPMADRFVYELYKSRSIIAVSDGGAHTAAAARVLTTAVRESKKFQINTCTDAVIQVTEAIAAAATELKHMMRVQGLTGLHVSLFIGMTLKLSTPQLAKDWLFVCAYVGQLRVFHYDPVYRKAAELTLRDVASEKKESKPMDAKGSFDPTSIRTSVIPCAENERIIVLSNGVWENLDIDHLGRKPADFGLTVSSFADMEEQDRARLASLHRCQLVEMLLERSFAPKSGLVCEKFCKDTIEFVKQMSLALANDFAQSPLNYKMDKRDVAALPGRLDHALALMCTIGPPPARAASTGDVGDDGHGGNNDDLGRDLDVEAEEAEEPFNPDDPRLRQLFLESPKARYKDFPRVRVKESSDSSDSFFVLGPGDWGGWGRCQKLMYGRSVSSYPHLPGKTKPEGFPICDRFTFSLFENRAVAIVADGCNWGTRPRDAAYAASNGFRDYLKRSQSKVVDTHKAGHHLLVAVSEAQKNIMKGKKDGEAGTTTLLGGMMFKSAQEMDDGKNFLFVAASVGDCKCFHIDWKTRKVTDATVSNRNLSKSARDPGGRLGAYKDGKPDLRNLALCYVRCHADDMIVLVSDGVHDNLDAEYLNVTPEEANLGHESWDKAPIDDMQNCKTVYREKLLYELLHDKDTPEAVTEKLLEWSLDHTRTSRQFLADFPKKKLPDDYKLYPGKMDHTTCMTWRASIVDPDVLAYEPGEYVNDDDIYVDPPHDPPPKGVPVQ